MSIWQRLVLGRDISVESKNNVQPYEYGVSDSFSCQNCNDVLNEKMDDFYCCECEKHTICQGCAVSDDTHNAKPKCPICSCSLEICEADVLIIDHPKKI